MSTIVRCRANDPANCRFPGHQSLHAPAQEKVVGMQQFFGASLPATEPEPVATANRASIATRRALKTSLSWKGAEPVWWKKFYNDSASHEKFPSQPEILDVIDSPVGKLAVVWQPESQNINDMSMAITSGSVLSSCYYKSFDTGEVVGYVKMTNKTDASIERTFGNDEFTPFRWQERYSGASFGFDAYGSELEPYGDRNLSGEALLQKRREVWVSAQKYMGEGVSAYTPNYGISIKDVPDDGQVQKDLKKFSRIINKDIQNKKEYYKTPYVDFSNVENSIKGEGLGSALYVYTARRLAKNNQVLRGSGTQSEDADKLWNGFRKRLKSKVASIELDYDGRKKITTVLDFRPVSR